MRKLFINRKFLFYLLIFFSCYGINASDRYKLLNFRLPSEKKGTIEVIEFFSYNCNHCKNMELSLQEWYKNIESDVSIKKIPVANNYYAQKLQKIYLTLEMLDKSELNLDIFEQISRKRNFFQKNQNIEKWLIKNKISIKRFYELYNSFGMEVKIKQANKLLMLCNIQETPIFVIGGKYLTSPVLAGNDYNNTIKEIELLINKCRLEKEFFSINENN